jgi:NAD(P)-dependent dehydrogenase (short-subunit alcohol dehydrogenase family)
MSTIRFDDRVVLVTGGGRGLGSAYAHAFADRGAAVVVHDAGVDSDGGGGDQTMADAVVDEIHSWGRMRRVNVDAPFHITRAAFPFMRQQSYGRLVFTTSGRAMSVDRTRPGLSAYAMGKMAHFALMIVAAREGEPHGIRANAIAPAAATRMLARAVEPGELEPEQVVPGVLFLASERCEVTGRVLEAAGGEFDLARWVSTDEVDFGREPVGPEAIAERWAKIEGMAEAV